MDWFTTLYVTVTYDVGASTVVLPPTWIVVRRHHLFNLGKYVSSQLLPIDPDTMVSITVQPYNAEGKVLRARLVGNPGEPVGPVSPFVKKYSDLDDLDYKVQLHD